MHEILFLCGPPFGGKTCYYEQHLKSSHERVSASELYQQNPGWGLRHFILHILSHLGEGRSVVIDDENWLRKTRESCIQSIRAKVPACNFRCLILVPKDAFECLRRREWVLAQSFLSRQENGSRSGVPAVDLPGTEARIHKWFRHRSGEHVSGIDAVQETEGWHQIQEVETILQPKTNYKFEVPAVFLDWHVLVEHSTDELAQGLLTWKQNTVCGRVIILATVADEVLDDQESEDSNEGDIYKSILKKIQTQTQVLTQKLNMPVFYIIIKDQSLSGSFSKPPEPGILSFLQRLHHIDIQHPRTVYIPQSKRNKVSNFARTGMKVFTADSVCRNPNILANCQGARIFSSSHESVGDFDYVAESEVQIPCPVPFANTVLKDTVDEHVEGSYIAKEEWGRVIGVSYSDKESFRRFQEDYTTKASHISAKGSRMAEKPLLAGTKRGSSSHSLQRHDPGSLHDANDESIKPSHASNIPAWMMPKKKGEDEAKEVENFDKYVGLPSTIYCMTVAELREVAKLFLDMDDDGSGSVASSPDSTDLIEPVSMIGSPQDEKELDGSYEGMKLEMEESELEEDSPEKMMRLDFHLQGEEGRRGTYREDGEEKDRIKGREQRREDRYVTPIEDGDDRDRRKGGVQGGEDGVASIITDLFSGEFQRKRPPPKKKAARTPFTTSTAIIWSDEEELPCQPKNSGKASDGTHQLRKKTKENEPQDLSFLDEIF